MWYKDWFGDWFGGWFDTTEEEEEHVDLYGSLDSPEIAVTGSGNKYSSYLGSPGYDQQEEEILVFINAFLQCQ